MTPLGDVSLRGGELGRSDPPLNLQQHFRWPHWWVAFLLASALGMGAPFLLNGPMGSSTMAGLALIMGFAGAATAVWVVYSATIGRQWALSLYLGLAIFLVDASLRTRSLDDTSLDWQSLLKSLVWMGAFVIGAMHFRRTYRMLFRFPAVLFVLYGLWALVSTSYSPTPTYTFGAAFAFLSVALFIPAVLYHLPASRVLSTVMTTLTTFLLLSWLVYFLAPELGQDSVVAVGGLSTRLSGLAGQANNLGRLAALCVGVVFLLYMYGYKRWTSLIWPFGLAVLTLGFTWSRTSVLAITGAIAVVLLRRKPWLLAVALCVVAGVTVFFAETGVDAVLASVSRTGDVQEIYTLTNRTELWRFVWAKASERMWTGYGYAASRAVISSEFNLRGWTTVSAHNTLLQVWLTTGVVGLALILSLIVRQFRDLITKQCLVHDLLLIYITVTGLVEAGAVGPVPSSATLLWAIAIYYRPLQAHPTVLPSRTNENMRRGSHHAEEEAVL